jgi:hypothetical protein
MHPSGRIPSRLIYTKRGLSVLDDRAYPTRQSKDKVQACRERHFPRKVPLFRGVFATRKIDTRCMD